MRCPDCNKFVGLDTQEPEEQSIDIDSSGNVTGEFRVERNCADCGTTLKSATFEIDEDISGAIEEHTDQADEPAEGVEPVEHELSISADSAEVNESGGGRYKANEFTIEVAYSVSCSCGKLQHAGSLTSGSIKASEFDEEV